ncbi:MAG TPA: hypothetical protein VEQ85_06245, partial [Lacipirellulaceae bacterium]|nr:hypothetical protein [Lacipirellulaceae bacterium]
MNRKFSLTSLGAALLLAGAAGRAAGADQLWLGGTADFNVPANWSETRVPTWSSDDRAVITNGGTAFVQATIADGPTSVVLGRDASTSGTLEVRNGGALTVVGLGSDPSNGNVIVGAAGTGTLRVLPGGTLDLFNSAVAANNSQLISGNNASNLIVLGGAAAGTATVNTSGATFGGTTQVFRNAVLSTNNGPITLTGTSVYSPVVAGAGAANIGLLDAGTGAVTLGGSFRPSFTAVPAVGSTWDVLHGNTIAGAFASVQPTGLGPGQRVSTSVLPGVTGQNLRMVVDQVLSLQVNRNTRTITLANPGAAPISIDGYAIQSALGLLNRNQWTSLDDQNALGGDWLESASSNANQLSELKPTSSGTLAGASSVSLGAAFQPNAAAPFGTTQEDLTFTYAKPDGTVVTGDVTYSGTAGINNIVLQVDPVDGKARMKNTSGYTVAIDGYSITSAAGSLNRTNWTSLDDQNVGDWLESTGSNANKLSELKPTGATTFAGGTTTVSLGTMFTPAAAQDLSFQFLLAGQSTPTTGVVVYESFLAGNADFDADGDVDGNDFVRWQRNLGAAGAAATLANGNANGDGVVNAADLAVWRDQAGSVRPTAVAATAAVPEPTAVALIGVAVART